MNTQDTPDPADRKPARKTRAPRKSVKQWIAAADEERDIRKAAAIYDAGLAQWPRSAHLLACAADHRERECHDRAGAEALHRRAVAAEPGDDFALEGLCDLLCKKRDGWKEAAEICRLAIERDPGAIAVRHQLIWILVENTQDLDAAERLHRECVRLAPRDSHQLRTFGRFLRDFRSDPAAAARLYTRALSLDGGGRGDCRFLRDQFLREARRNASIERPLRRALARAPRDASIRRALGIFLISVRHQFEEGERLLRGTVPAELRTPSALRAAARIFESKPETGREWALQIEWAAQLAPHHPGIASRYAALKHPDARYFDEGTESLV